MISRRMRTKELVDLIKDELLSSDLKPGSPILSAKDFAHKYNTSVLTAHKVLKGLADEGIINRVIGSGSFVSERVNKKKSFRIGIGFATYPKDEKGNDVAFNTFHNSTVEELRSRGHEALYLTYHDLLNSEYMRKLDEELDGLILTKGFIDYKTTANIKRLRNRTVVIQHINPFFEKFHQVVPDLYGGYIKALGNISKPLGDKIYAVGLKINQDRIEIFRRAAATAGIASASIDEIGEPLLNGDYGWETGRRLGEKFARMEKPFIVSVSDFLSFGIVEVMLKNGKKPGTDFTLISFDDLEGDGFIPFGEPLLSSITFPKREIVVNAIEILNETIEKAPVCALIRRIDTSFIQRKTTAGVQ